uniref:Transcription factor CBF/NF-Y/archaeal histone domain-containing protein n=1 Tax=Ananas comosus var. bracteatus TaxID=296719 RepID=A0A6V7NH32_ANACO|nr:unnamed protein product [Ananas comosus var. bracteatus]
MAKKGEAAAAAEGSAAADLAAPPPPPAPALAVEELPKAVIRRIVKDKLSQLASAATSDGGGGEEMTVNKDALVAFTESARIFIHYLSATANDVCKELGRQTINAEDVLRAVEEIEFPEFIDPLRASLEEFRKKTAVKKSGVKAKETDKKRKLEEELPSKGGKNGVEDAEEENDDPEPDDD